MTQRQTVVTTAKIGQRGRLILPAQIQRAALIGSGDTVAVRTSEDGTITIEPLWAVRNRLRATFTVLLDGHLPAGPARMLVGGTTLTKTAGPLPVPMRPLSPASPEDRAVVPGDCQAVFTARAVLAGITGEHTSRMDLWLSRAVLPESAVTELFTILARAGTHERADALLADLAVLGVQIPGPAKHRAHLAEDTALALELTAEAAREGVEVPMPDALCTAAAHRLGVPLFAADLLPTQQA
ncbi:AbrB/MazE/SpoVT family DNA-binding domain-containing protein [Kitasatospora sp. NPDC089797]|uniref:AbrB/MazE/SpoVT family DNA-binding domain-containing protein n=1 Tax=Kitasatospora sp. NPDC089797 TaxID=3155298 RepID=UPI003420DADE